MSTVWLGGHLEALVFTRMVIFTVIFSYFRGYFFNVLQGCNTF